MSQSNSVVLKTVSTIGYTIALLFTLNLLNILTNWLFGYIVGPVFDWFYKINIVYKILLIVFGAPTILYIVFDLSKILSLYINRFFSKLFIETSATVIISIILVIANIVLGIIDIWYLVHWDFWIIILWLIMVIFIIEINGMLLIKTDKKSLH